MTMVKRFAAMALAVSLTATLLAGCGEKQQSNATLRSTSQSATTTQESQAQTEYGDTGGLKLPVVDKPVTVKWMLSSDELDLNTKPVIQEIGKRTGVSVDVQAVPSASYAEKIKIILASGKLPDIMEGIPAGELNIIGAQGALAAINKYADELPNFKKLYMEENSWVMKSYSDDKGNIYTWPVYNLSRDVNHGFMYRKDIFDKLGIKEWTTTDEFYKALKKLKEKYPNSYPYASKNGANIFKDWSFSWGFSGDSTYPVYFDRSDNTWKLVTTQPGFKDMLDFMKKLYNEGLLDPEFISDTEASWTAKMTSEDKAFVTYDWIGRLEMFYTQVKDKMPDYNLRYANPVGPTGLHKTLNKILNFGTAIAVNENTEAALKMMDYLTSPSGAELITMGIKNTEFTLDASGKPVYPELKDMAKVDISTLTKKYGCWLESMYLNVDRRSVYFTFTEKEQEAQDKIVKQNKFVPLDPILKFTNEESAVIGDLQSNLDKDGVEFATKYVVTKSYGDAQWNEWLKKAEKDDASKLAGVYNSAQKRYDSAK